MAKFLQYPSDTQLNFHPPSFLLAENDRSFVQALLAFSAEKRQRPVTLSDFFEGVSTGDASLLFFDVIR